jgi:hypothetical protein
VDRVDGSPTDDGGTDDVLGETIWRRSAMMANGSCAWAEYRRMVMEKMSAARGSAPAVMTNASIVSSWDHGIGALRATQNVCGAGSDRLVHRHPRLLAAAGGVVAHQLQPSVLR